MPIRQAITAIALALLSLPMQAFAAITAFYYTSSAESWVGHGETVLVSPVDGRFEFTASRNFGNGVSVSINDFNTNPEPQTFRWWYLDFAAPDGAPLSVGIYNDATRFPFQSPGEPGLSFIGNARGDNTLTGAFSVLEAVFANDGTVLSFAADFVQYDEGFQNWWNIGSIRYNSSVDLPALPEPSTPLLVVMGLGLCVLWSTARRRANLGR